MPSRIARIQKSAQNFLLLIENNGGDSSIIPAAMNPKPFDLVIFDCDGVLVDSEPLANRVFVQIVREYGCEIEEKPTLKKFSGMIQKDRVHAIERELNWTAPGNFLEIFKERFAHVTKMELQIVPGIHDLVESLSVPICIASNGSRKEIAARLEVAKLTEHFGDAIFSGLDVPHPKPAPDVYLAAAEAFDVSPDRCIVIEDSVPGVTAAVRAGMKVYGHAALTPVESLRNAGAIPFENMRELQTILSEAYKISTF
jgi:HAD superfamily hydrolase (TIGR01509 family)